MPEEEVVIQIEGMTCSACATGVAASLRRVEGVIEAEVSIEPPEAHIRFDTSDAEQGPCGLVSRLVI